MEKPIGTFKCVVCQQIWDGSQLIQDANLNWTCGDAFCGGQTYGVSNEPKSRPGNGEAPQEKQST